MQVYLMWRNMAIAVTAICILIILSTFLHGFLSPIFSTVCAFILYILVYSVSSIKSGACMLVPYSVFISFISYTFFVVVINLINIWSPLVELNDELNIFYAPYLPILLLAPTGFFICLCVMLRGIKASICIDCRIAHGNYNTRGRFGLVLHRESPLQLRNLTLLFLLISAFTWWYYLAAFNSVNLTARDYFVFTWIPLMVFLAYIFYLGFRYYNLYIEFKERDEIVTPEELSEQATKTYLRFYVICGDHIYLNLNAPDELDDADKEGLIETPFLLNRCESSVSEAEAERTIRHLTDIHDGKLRFFFVRKSQDNAKHRVLRYFYFLPGKKDDYPTLNGAEGTWVSSNEFKTFFYNSKMRLSPLLNIDMNRLATILITSKIYNSNGERKIKLKQYRPSFDFIELQNSDIDFQDTFWLKVAYFNSDMPNFRFKRWLRGVTRSRSVSDI